MSETSEKDTPEALLERIVRWAESRADVRAVILTGSHAREDGTADELSDLDVELFLAAPDALAGSTEWLSEIGFVWVCLPLETSEGYPTRLVIFEGGLKVDFTLYPADIFSEGVKSKRSLALYHEGYRVLLDKGGLAAVIPRSLEGYAPEAKPPTEEEFCALVEEFWFEAYHVAKYLKREDLWAAKVRDWGVKELLLRMIEWQARSRHGWSFYETWHLGIRIRDWAEPEVWQRLSSIFGRFDLEDSWRALEGTADLFSQIGHDVAGRMEYRYPDDVERNLRSYIRSLQP